jgi:hypothetical protein
MRGSLVPRKFTIGTSRPRLGYLLEGNAMNFTSLIVTIAGVPFLIRVGLAVVSACRRQIGGYRRH